MVSDHFSIHFKDKCYFCNQWYITSLSGKAVWSGIMKFRSSIFKNMRQFRLWSLIFIFSRKNMLRFMTLLEDTPMSNTCNRSSIEVKETIPKTKDKNYMSLLILNSANSKTSNRVFKTEVPSQGQKLVKLIIKLIFWKVLSVLCKIGQPL